MNTSPSATRRIFLVRVAEPDISMEPPDEVVYLNAGSKLALTCSVYAGGLTPQFIMWYRDDRIVSYSSQSDDNQDNDGVVTKMWSDNSTDSRYPRHYSRLTIDSVSQSDSGEYRCDSDLTGEASVNVYVVRADLKSLASDQNVVAAAAAGEVLSSDEENKASSSTKLTLDLKTTLMLLLAVTYLLRS